MMEYPTQVGECIGCGICVRECPVQVVMLDTVAGNTPLASRQGPLTRPVAAAQASGWIPLSEVTRESLKPDHPEPFAPLFTWRTSERPQPWQAWRTMVDERRDPRAPCQNACPAGTDAGRYVGLIAQGRYDDAYAVAAEVNPFPSVCGWICTAPCESACRRGTLDEPVAIRSLKRFAAEHGRLPAIQPPKTRRPERVAIVGGGPAGMSAAYYLARLGYGVTVFEAMPVPGGMMAIGIPAYRLPREALREEIDRIVGLGVELRLDTAMGRDFSLSDLEAHGYKAVFLSTGASKSRRLGVPGDQLAGVVPATLFLKQVNLGEGPRLAGPVVVVGGGSTAMDAARSALRSGADSVTVLYRRGRAEMPAQREEVDAAEREGVTIRTGIVVDEVLGNGRAGSIRCSTQQSTGRVELGRAVWEAVAGSDFELSCATILADRDEDGRARELEVAPRHGLPDRAAGFDATGRLLRAAADRAGTPVAEHFVDDDAGADRDAFALGRVDLLALGRHLGASAPVEDGHRVGAAPERGARGVHGGAATADDDHGARETRPLAQVDLLEEERGGHDARRAGRREPRAGGSCEAPVDRKTAL